MFTDVLCEYCSCLLKPFKKRTYFPVVVRRKRKMSLSLEERCLMVLKKCGPSTVPKLFKELEKLGLQPHGKTPKNTVSATVSERCGRKPGHPQTFIRKKNEDGHFVYFYTPTGSKTSSGILEGGGGRKNLEGGYFLLVFLRSINSPRSLNF